ncbi:Extracellular matrix-binding ebh, putative [Babesia ovata]|uniref:Extracellular matrix-binding ebh, putative n=1 Tax=Babesia ovata TaxID=189622 RepID=A0A2H6KAS4_9APIC|nr:Extracellular matrix-binding ebh, putative [Babesia ovata]GBE60093.1 Extracellular matrix-binding ebh, putative [Babesia ovata]
MFENNVIRELKDAVSLLPDAVNKFDTAAQAQIKDAAETAITKAAEQISEDNFNITLGDDLMKEFEEAHEKIRDTNDGLQPKLQALVDTHIGKREAAGALPFRIVEEVKLAKDHFTLYRAHVKQPVSSILTGKSEANEGLLPAAIGKIKTQVDTALKLIDTNGGHKAEIDKDTFTGPFEKIKTELEGIKKLVTKEGDPKGPEDGAKDLLEKLKNALNTGTLEGAVKGLDAIKTAIDGLKKGNLHAGPEAIEKAIGLIKTQLKTLRGLLKAASGYDVIETSTDLRDKGLANEAGWRIFSARNTLAGLGRLHERLGYQNGILAKQPAMIDAAIRGTRDGLAVIGYKLDHKDLTDDVLDPLRWLKNKTGKDQDIRGSLKDIYYTLYWLQREQFTNCPQIIHEANEAIKD